MRTKIALRISILLCFLCGIVACRSPKEETKIISVSAGKVPFAQLSQGLSPYLNFDSPKAINTIVEMENQYFAAFDDSVSPFYGTIWREYLEADSIGRTRFERYRRLVNKAADSMHCTIYAVKTLEAGMGEDFEKLEKSHRQIWEERACGMEHRRSFGA